MGQSNLGWGHEELWCGLKNTRIRARRTGFKPLLYFVLVVDPELFVVPLQTSFFKICKMGVIIHTSQGCCEDLLWEGLKFFSSAGWKETAQSPEPCSTEPQGAGELLCIFLVAAAVLPSLTSQYLLRDSTQRMMPLESTEWCLVWRGHGSLFRVCILF